ncbi:MAG: inositol monophosphatase family protein [Hyphomonas sp.]
MRAAERTLEEDLSLLCSLAHEAGDLALSYLHHSGGEAWNKPGGKGPVTEADLAINRLCDRTLRSARPDYGWLSEETLDDPAARQKSRVWVVDPIDGTRAYMDGTPDWCIGLALVEEGEAVGGVIYAPALGQFFAARKGGGARRNGTAIRVTGRTGESGLRLIANEGVVTHPGWREPWPEVHLARPKPNATLLRLAFVAAGEWDAALVLGAKNDWDIAAGAVLVAEAGGTVTTHAGEPLVFNRPVPAQRSVVASGNALHPLLVRRTGYVSLPDPQARAPKPPARDTTEPVRKMADKAGKQLLHIVFGGELKDVTSVEFEDLSKIDFVGAFPNYQEAYDAWKAAAQRTVDHAETRYFILHAHRLLDPATGDTHHV